MKNMRRYLISVQNISPSSLARSLRSCNLYCGVQVDDKTSSAKANVSSSPSKASNSQILDHVNIPSPHPPNPTPACWKPLKERNKNHLPRKNEENRFLSTNSSLDRSTLSCKQKSLKKNLREKNRQESFSQSVCLSPPTLVYQRAC